MIELATTPLEQSDLAGLVWSLQASRLPTDDLEHEGRIFFRFDADSLIGYGGLQGSGTDVLLRSVVVLYDRRGLGLGGLIVAELENRARQMGAVYLHLLTTNAAPFFRALGYVDRDRASVPAAIANSEQFTSLCPGSAAYLVKELP